jgi:hypothetical protein
MGDNLPFKTHYDSIKKAGEWGFKIPTEKFKSIKKCKTTGLVLMTIRNAHHLGRIGTYGEQSIAAGLIKSILVMVTTPFVAKYVGLDNPRSAMIFGGLMGTNSGVAAGLAATDPKLVPYGAMTATFYTGLGCLMAPSILYLSVAIFYV